ncbi:MAG: response regulator transcription factor [Mesorhizobium sp.]|nr:MAG: response regulator transcription factor [Mesorhizobium sp.]
MLGQTVLPAETSTFIQDIRHGPKHDAVADELTNDIIKVEDEVQDLEILSNRENCILRRLIEGESNKAIAREINIAEATVKVHVKAILRKIRVRNRTQAAVWAMNHGMLTPASGNAPSGSEKMATQPSHNINISSFGQVHSLLPKLRPEMTLHYQEPYAQIIPPRW